MQKQYNKVFSFVISVITRWGTQLAMVRSISRVKAAIYEFFEAIWSNLTLTLGFLEPLDKAIRMSEADHAVIGYVVPRWKQLRSYLVTGAQEWRSKVWWN